MTAEALSGGFELIGHDCPLGVYPSMVVPVGLMKGEVFVAYAGSTSATFHVVRSDVKFIHHNNSTSSALRSFDARKHGLFALNNAELVLYELGDERTFFKRLLKYSTAFYIEPYYRFSLALETDELSLIRPLYASCVRRLKRNAPEFLGQWIDAMAATSEVCAVLGREALNRIEGSSSAQRSVSVAAALERPRLGDAVLLPPGVSPSMNASTIRSAVNEMTVEDVTSRSMERGPYSKAVLLSLGFSEPGSPAANPDRPPTVGDVVRISGFSLPHLEFLNIILSKATAVKFLQLAESGLQSDFLARELFRSEIYERKFNRRAAKIKRRLVFTFAEVLSLVGYSGPIEPPPPI